MDESPYQGEAKFVLRDVSFYYGDEVALRDIDLQIYANEILAIFGPAMSGKSTLLRVLNRLSDLAEEGRLEGEVLLDGKSIHDPDVSVTQLRTRVGIVFAVPVPLPLSIEENVTYGPLLQRGTNKKALDEVVERSLKAAALWDEVKDRLSEPATALSGGQQQRLCLARVLALEPEVVLLDEPCSGLDPISTMKVENALLALKEDHSIVIVPHNVQQASRIGDKAAFLLMGELVEYGSAEDVFTKPKDQRTDDYITGRFG
ncbi:MAG: phosphate ABC transporter ATP-binding protein [Anaerolineae bacterium]|nr:phosphate ABC transporter ATP-binding protein [Anaerolineae bacterium]NIN97267.1 phosphate ABC transporter ATP-binding protein [Anaerolineae bacterium]NIQ80197.1 phosphate ABC transporter ATP-binding protein [Anaerolineae bacterium]